MSFDISTIPDQVLRSMAMGLVTEEESFADQVCTRITGKTTLNGTIPSKTSASTLGRLYNAGLAPGEVAKDHEGGVATTAYACKAYVGARFVYDEERNDLSVYGVDEIRDAARLARAVANLNIDAALATLLASTTENEEFDCNTNGNGEWDDQVNGTPLEDLLAAKYDQAPGSDCLIYGPEAMRALLAHPDVVAEISHFNAGQLDISGLNTLLASKLQIPVENIFRFEKLYNGAAEGAAVTTAFLFDEGVWMGHKRDLIMVDPLNALINNKLEIERVVERRAHRVQYERYVDLKRLTQPLGVYFSNVIT